MKEELKEYGLHVRWSDNPDREPIDFSIEDDNDNIAWVWGSEPWNDVQVECNHPHELIEFDDDETVGECILCGATCDWHYQTSADDGYTIKERIPHEWYSPKKIGGVIGKYLKYLQEEW